MNIMQEDNKIVDLITFVGDAFPKSNFLVDPGSNTHTVQTDHLHVHASSGDKLEAGNCSSSGGEKDLERISPCLSELAVDDNDPLIRALIKPHEGVYCCDPFDIHPRQIVSVYL